MRVYRVISAREITNVYKNKSERVAIVEGENTHKYENNASYIHFFRYYESAEQYFKKYHISLNSQDKYIAFMVANIPNEILRMALGYGFYNLEEDFFNAYSIPIPEYAIKKELMLPKYVVEVNNNISYEYKNENNEYEKYLNLIKKLAKGYDYDFQEVANYLQTCNLEDLLNVHDDDRTESQILDDKVKELCKVFPLYD